MTDIVDTQTRSYVMSRVRSTQNKSTELKLISIFKELNIKGWRRGSKLKGKPDFIFPKNKIAIFVDGCFWHGHECRKSIPQTNIDYWMTKIAKNKLRDFEVSEYLQNKKWNVIRIWECELKKKHKDILYEKLQPLITQL